MLVYQRVDGWFVSASSCAFLLEDSNLFVSIHFDQVRLHRWRDTCPVCLGGRTLVPRVSSRVSTIGLLSQNLIPIIYISPKNLRILRFLIRTYDKIWSNLCSKNSDPSQPQLISVQPLDAICFSNATRYSGQAKMPGFSSLRGWKLHCFSGLNSRFGGIKTINTYWYLDI